MLSVPGLSAPPRCYIEHDDLPATRPPRLAGRNLPRSARYRSRRRATMATAAADADSRDVTAASWPRSRDGSLERPHSQGSNKDCSGRASTTRRRPVSRRRRSSSPARHPTAVSRHAMRHRSAARRALSLTFLVVQGKSEDPVVNVETPTGLAQRTAARRPRSRPT